MPADSSPTSTLGRTVPRTVHERVQALIAAIPTLATDPEGHGWRRAWHPGLDMTQPGTEPVLDALVEAAVGRGPTQNAPHAKGAALRALRSPLRNGTRLTRRAVLLAYEMGSQDLLDGLLRQVSHLSELDRALLLSQAALVRVPVLNGDASNGNPDDATLKPGDWLGAERRERLLNALAQAGLPTTLKLDAATVRRVRRQDQATPGFVTFDISDRPVWASERWPGWQLTAPSKGIARYYENRKLRSVEWELGVLWGSSLDPAAILPDPDGLLVHAFNARVEQVSLRHAIDEARTETTGTVIVPCRPNPRRRL